MAVVETRSDHYCFVCNGEVEVSQIERDQAEDFPDGWRCCYCAATHGKTCKTPSCKNEPHRECEDWAYCAKCIYECCKEEGTDPEETALWRARAVYARELDPVCNGPVIEVTAPELPVPQGGYSYAAVVMIYLATLGAVFTLAAHGGAR